MTAIGIVVWNLYCENLILSMYFLSLDSFFSFKGQQNFIEVMFLSLKKLVYPSGIDVSVSNTPKK